MLIQPVAVRHLEIFERRKAFAQAHYQCRDAFYVISLSQSAVFAPCRLSQSSRSLAQTKRIADSGNEIARTRELPPHSGKTSTHALTLSISDRVVIFPRFVLRVVVFEVFKIKTAPYVNYVCNYFILSLYTNSNHEKKESVRKLVCVSQKSRELFGSENISRHISGTFFAFKKKSVFQNV